MKLLGENTKGVSEAQCINGIWVGLEMDVGGGDGGEQQEQGRN